MGPVLFESSTSPVYTSGKDVLNGHSYPKEIGIEHDMINDRLPSSQLREENVHVTGSTVSGPSTNGEALVSDEEDATVIIVGAGPVGLMLALRLAQSQIRSVVLEASPKLSQAPRAIGYYGPVHQVFKDAGIYERVARDGMPSGGYVWRKPLQDDPQGGKILGPIIGENIMATPDADGKYEIEHYSIQLAQSLLAQILLEEGQQTGLVTVHWNHQVTSLTQDSTHVSVSASSPAGARTLRARYLAGCDGGKSTVRKLLSIRLAGHSWPERFVATDVLRTPPVIPPIPVHFVVDPSYWGVVTPLEHVVAGTRGLWRYSMAVADQSLTDEQVLDPTHVNSLLERQIDGPRPSDHEVVRKSLYKMHQLLATTMHRGRCFLAGDAAHINNPIGGLGLCTGLLDADALHQTLERVLVPGPGGRGPEDPEELFGRYSEERRRVFQMIIHPLSSANKMRLHGGAAEDTAREDWYFRALRRGNKKELEKIHRPLYEEWRSNLRA